MPLHIEKFLFFLFSKWAFFPLPHTWALRTPSYKLFCPYLSSQFSQCKQRELFAPTLSSWQIRSIFLSVCSVQFKYNQEAFQRSSSPGEQRIWLLNGLVFAYCRFASFDGSQEVFIFPCLFATVWSCSAGFVGGAVPHFSDVGEKQILFGS